MKKFYLFFLILTTCLFWGRAESSISNKVGLDQMLERFLAYAKIESQSINGTVETPFPITEGERKIARLIYEEVKAMGGKNVKVTLSDNYYVYIDIPSNADREVPSLLLMAHMDVTPDVGDAGVEVKPIVHRNYDGGDLKLPSGIILSSSSPYGAHLKDLTGKTIVTGDGNAVLGADDKTGCAVLITLAEELIKNPDFKHGRVMIALSQNEDVGLSAVGYDPIVFGDKPDYVVDVDGADYGNYSIANFTAVNHTYYFKGNDVHPGRAKAGRYADALSAAAYFIGQIPAEIHPSNREGEEGYIHCFSMEHPIGENGEQIKTDYVLKFRLRYFDKNEGDYHKRLMEENLLKVQQAFPFVDITKTSDILQYENIAYTLPSNLPAMIERASQSSGMPMSSSFKRGGTTVCLIVAAFPDAMPGGPGIYSGQQAIHSHYEWACMEELLQLVNICENLITEVLNSK